MSAPIPPTARIRYRNGMEVECPVRYLGWYTPDSQDHPFHVWRVLNEGPFDCREGDAVMISGGTLPQFVETPGTGPR